MSSFSDFTKAQSRRRARDLAILAQCKRRTGVFNRRERLGIRDLTGTAEIFESRMNKARSEVDAAYESWRGGKRGIRDQPAALSCQSSCSMLGRSKSKRVCKTSNYKVARRYRTPVTYQRKCKKLIAQYASIQLERLLIKRRLIRKGRVCCTFFHLKRCIKMNVQAGGLPPELNEPPESSPLFRMFSEPPKVDPLQPPQEQSSKWIPIDNWDSVLELIGTLNFETCANTALKFADVLVSIYNLSRVDSPASMAATLYTSLRMLSSEADVSAINSFVARWTTPQTQDSSLRSIHTLLSEFWKTGLSALDSPSAQAVADMVIGLMHFGFLSTADDSYMKTWAYGKFRGKIVDKLANSFDVVSAVFESSLLFLDMAATYMEEGKIDILGWSFGSRKDIFAEMAKLESSSSDATLGALDNNLRSSDDYQSTQEYLTHLDEVIDKVTHLVRRAKMPAEKHMLANRLTRLLNIKNSVSLHFKAIAAREKPFTFCVFGTTSSMKSIVCQAVWRVVAHQQGISHSSENYCTANLKDPYFSELQRQQIVVIDDFMNERIEAMGPGINPIRILLDWSSNNPVQIPAAAVEDKGKRYACMKIFGLTCFDKDFRAGTLSYQPEAAFRRVEVFIEAKMKAEFRNAEGQPDSTKIPQDVPFPDIWTFDLWVCKIVGTESSWVMTHSDLSNTEMLEAVKARSATHFALQQSIVKRLNQGEWICPHGNICGACHSCEYEKMVQREDDGEIFEKVSVGSDPTFDVEEEYAKEHGRILEAFRQRRADDAERMLQNFAERGKLLNPSDESADSESGEDEESDVEELEVSQPVFEPVLIQTQCPIEVGRSKDACLGTRRGIFPHRSPDVQSAEKVFISAKVMWHTVSFLFSAIASGSTYVWSGRTMRFDYVLVLLPWILKLSELISHYWQTKKDLDDVMTMRNMERQGAWKEFLLTLKGMGYVSEVHRMDFEHMSYDRLPWAVAYILGMQVREDYVARVVMTRGFSDWYAYFWNVGYVDFILPITAQLQQEFSWWDFLRGKTRFPHWCVFWSSCRLVRRLSVDFCVSGLNHLYFVGIYSAFASLSIFYFPVIWLRNMILMRMWRRPGMCLEQSIRDVFLTMLRLYSDFTYNFRDCMGLQYYLTEWLINKPDYFFNYEEDKSQLEYVLEYVNSLGLSAQLKDTRIVVFRNEQWVDITQECAQQYFRYIARRKMVRGIVLLSSTAAAVLAAKKVYDMVLGYHKWRLRPLEDCKSRWDPKADDRSPPKYVAFADDPWALLCLHRIDWSNLTKEERAAQIAWLMEEGYKHPIDRAKHHDCPVNVTQLEYETERQKLLDMEKEGKISFRVRPQKPADWYKEGDSFFTTSTWTSPELQSSIEQIPVALAKESKTRFVKVDQNNYFCHSAMETMEPIVTKNYLRRALFHATLTFKKDGGTVIRSTHMVAIGGHDYLIPTHALERDMIIKGFSGDPSAIGGHFHVRYDPRLTAEIKGSDYSVIRLRGTHMRASILKLVPMSTINHNSRGVFMWYDKETKEFCESSRWDLPALQGRQRVMRNNHPYKTIPLYMLDKPPFMMPMNTFGGLCGAIWAGIDKTGRYFLHSLHIAGYEGEPRGGSHPINQKQLSFCIAALDKKEGVLNPEIGPLKTSFVIDQSIPPRYPLNFIVDTGDEDIVRSIVPVGSHNLPTSKYNQKIVEAEYIDELTEAMSWKKDLKPVPHPNSSKHLHNALTTWTAPKDLFKGDLVERVFDEIGAKYSRVLNELCDLKETLHPLPYECAISGADGIVGVDSLNYGTSMGFPIRGPKRKHLVPTVFEGISEAKIFTPEIMEQIQDLEKQLEARQRIFAPFSAAVKIEVMKNEKEFARIFTCCNAHFSVLFRKYFLPIFRLMHLRAGELGVSLGLNAHSQDWHQLADMMRFKERMMAGDFKNYDQSVPSRFLLYVGKVLIDIAAQAGYSESQLQIMWGLIHEIAYPLIEANGVLFFALFHVSGQNGTLVFNSIVNEALHMYAYYDRIPEQFVDDPTMRFHECINQTYTGDDSLLSVHPKVTWFNQQVMADVMKDCGIVYTDCNKSQEIRPFEKLSDVTYLSRYFRYDEETKSYVAPLKERSLTKSYCYLDLDTSIAKSELIYQIVEQNDTELYFKGRDYYDYAAPTVRRIIGKYYPDLPKLLTYDEMSEKLRDRISEVSYGYNVQSGEVRLPDLPREVRDEIYSYISFEDIYDIIYSFSIYCNPLTQGWLNDMVKSFHLEVLAIENQNPLTLEFAFSYGHFSVGPRRRDVFYKAVGGKKARRLSGDQYRGYRILILGESQLIVEEWAYRERMSLPRVCNYYLNASENGYVDVRYMLRPNATSNIVNVRELLKYGPLHSFSIVIKDLPAFVAYTARNFPTSNSNISSTMSGHNIVHEYHMTGEEVVSRNASSLMERDVLAGSADNFKDYLERVVHIGTLNWTGGGTVLAQTYDVLDSIFKSPPIRGKLNYFNEIVFDLEITLEVVGNPFLYGLFLASWQPYVLLDDLTQPRDSIFEDLVEASQRQHVLLDVSDSTSTVMRIPFFWPHEYFSITRDEPRAFGNLWIRQINPLSHVQGGDPSLSILVRARMINVGMRVSTSQAVGTRLTMNVQTGDLVVQAGDEKPHGAISSITTKIADLAHMSIPITGEKGVATEMVMRGATSMLQAVGLAHPRDVREPMRVVQNPVGNLSSYNVAQDVETLALDVENEVSFSPTTTGLAEDEMSFDHIMGRETFLGTFNWDVGNDPGSRLAQFDVHPMKARDVQTSGPLEIHATPTAYMAQLFEYWTGSFTFRFQFVSTKWHRGKCRIMHDPTFYASSNAEVDASWQNNLLALVDLSAEKDFQITINWCQPYQWAGTRSLDAHPPWMYGPDRGYSASDLVDSNGVISIHVVNRLTIPDSTVTAPVYVNVYVKAGPDFRFAVPRDYVRQFTFAPLSLPSGAVPPTEMSKQIMKSIVVGSSQYQQQPWFNTGSTVSVPVYALKKDDPIAVTVTAITGATDNKVKLTLQGGTPVEVTASAASAPVDLILTGKAPAAGTSLVTITNGGTGSVYFTKLSLPVRPGYEYVTAVQYSTPPIMRADQTNDLDYTFAPEFGFGGGVKFKSGSSQIRWTTYGTLQLYDWQNNGAPVIIISKGNVSTSLGIWGPIDTTAPPDTGTSYSVWSVNPSTKNNQWMNNNFQLIGKDGTTGIVGDVIFLKPIKKLTVQSGDVMDMGEGAQETAPTMASMQQSHIPTTTPYKYFGEQVTHLRQLLGRWTCNSVYSYAATTALPSPGPVIGHVVISPNYPIYPSINIPPAVGQNYRMNVHTWLHTMYAGRRGSYRTRYVVHGDPTRVYTLELQNNHLGVGAPTFEQIAPATNLVQSQRVDSGNGVVVTSVAARNALAAEFPYYYRRRFLPCRHSNTINSLLSSRRHGVYILHRSDAFILDRYQQAGEDFTLVNFLGTPRVYIPRP